jgi:hypothetical protein
MPVQDNRTRRVLYRRVRRADCDSWLQLEGFHTVCLNFARRQLGSDA